MCDTTPDLPPTLTAVLVEFRRATLDRLTALDKARNAESRTLAALDKALGREHVADRRPKGMSPNEPAGAYGGDA